MGFSKFKNLLKNRKFRVAMVLTLIFVPVLLSAQTAFPKLIFGVEDSANPQDFGLSLKILALMTVLALAPSILIMMTSFTRIVIVFHFLRSALATQTAPSNQILAGLALFITFFIMQPVFTRINDTALQPYLKEQITQEEAFELAKAPIREFMFKQVKTKSLELFLSFHSGEKPNSKEEVPMMVLIPAFIVSELTIAFQIGFLLYLPMLLIDMIVASVLMSMGMMMLPPVMISMPFKIMLFVLVDGWNLIVESIVLGMR